MEIVKVYATWETETEFEFDTEEEAEEFRLTVNDGGAKGLDKIIEKGDIFPDTGELMDWNTD